MTTKNTIPIKAIGLAILIALAVLVPSQRNRTAASQVTQTGSHYQVGAYEYSFLIRSSFQQQSWAAPIAPGVVSWWPGDGTATDIAGGNNGTVHGATFAPGQVDQSFSFDGVDDYVEIASSPTLQFGNGDFTIDFWARILDPFVNAHALITTQPVATDPPGILVHSRGIAPPVNTVLFDIRDGVNTQTITVPVPTDLQFHYFAFTRSGTDIRGYVDGVDQTTVVNAVGVANMNSPANLLFGRNGLSTSVGHYFAGQLDELEIHNRTLTAAEIQTMFDAGNLGTTPKRLVAVCHNPDTPAQKTLVIPFAALSHHLGHGDTTIPCE